MKAVAKYLAAVFKDRNLDEDAKALGFKSVDMIKIYKGDKQVSTPQAIAIGELTGCDPRKLLQAQIDDELDALGIEKPKKVADAQPAQTPISKPRDHGLSFRG